MTRNTQQKFETMLDILANAHGFEVINDRQFANTGRIRIERPADFAPIVSFRYDFQSGHDAEYARITEADPPFGDSPGDPTRCHHVVPSELIPRVFDKIEAIITAKAAVELVKVGILLTTNEASLLLAALDGFDPDISTDPEGGWMREDTDELDAIYEKVVDALTDAACIDAPST